MGRAQHGAHRGRARAVRLALLAALVVPLTTGCTVEEALRFGWPNGVTPQAEAMRELWTWSAIAALVVGAVTWGAMFWAVAFHRKKKGDDDSPPRQTQYNLPVEIAFTVIPTVIVAVLFGFTVNVQNYVDTDTADPDLAVDIRGFQWNWEFTYPESQGPDGQPVSTLGDSSTIPLLVLPTESRIQFTQASSDVIHSFFVPEFLFKRDVFPLPEKNNQDNVWQIDGIDRQGSFVGRCAELCGTYHSQMNFEVRALPQDLFDRWLDLRSQVNPATGEGYTAGEALGELGCGVDCAPAATTTVPYNTDRAARTASGTVAAGN
ncbi:cytochrome c oxidase subunit II [Pseudonocardia sp. KRD-184]|uniref:Cytochrome aa3 subunit 2 n=1 Tax=Pseudonocardia oceani TaxID=2792013 RepID=A0ABS6U3P4_9PSEU|nr:cytochrome c oxidase subunit II [Pseudonocardia oceani]MBW0091933.1 cytochrome c oxidase subunit II [Pseudonocardia oceani]MBW0098827.1 cytochrome c oxidase subunit II [Pseudonocardia oceani]MBW0111322.1 cytochrome c oxidase subunit II [Pseudonocardia oceani]MBW0124283.1 cytochrome c oxidase subunit II [Pseudonocardia oceani]MBW0126828.1 cytochrome c oxidase subunit II [Pseudonocardia oceani]